MCLALGGTVLVFWNIGHIVWGIYNSVIFGCSEVDTNRRQDMSTAYLCQGFVEKHLKEVLVELLNKKKHLVSKDGQYYLLVLSSSIKHR